MGYILVRMLQAGIVHEFERGNMARANILSAALARVIVQYNIIGS